MSARLYAIVHDLPGRLWCGPAAVAAVTGAPTSRIHAIIAAERATHGFRRGEGIKGTWPNELRLAMFALGYRCIWHAGANVAGTPRPTFAQFRRARAPELRDAALVVSLTGHFVALAGNRLVDNRYRDPIMASDYPHQRTRVEGAYAVTRL